jgi:hypothetical protein
VITLAELRFGIELVEDPTRREPPHARASPRFDWSRTNAGRRFGEGVSASTLRTLLECDRSFVRSAPTRVAETATTRTSGLPTCSTAT